MDSGTRRTPVVNATEAIERLRIRRIPLPVRFARPQGAAASSAVRDKSAQRLILISGTFGFTRVARSMSSAAAGVSALPRIKPEYMGAGRVVCRFARIDHCRYSGKSLPQQACRPDDAHAKVERFAVSLGLPEGWMRTRKK